MMLGKNNAAVKMLSNSSIGIHSVVHKVLKELQNKHPDPFPIKEGTFLCGPLNRVLPSYFDSIDEAMVLKEANLSKGAGGPSQLDSRQYRHILSSRKFKKENKELREQICQLARLLASEIVDPYTVEALVACRFITFNKKPGCPTNRFWGSDPQNYRKVYWMGSEERYPRSGSSIANGNWSLIRC